MNSGIRLIKLSPAEYRQRLAAIRSDYEQTKAAIAALVTGAQSASISTAGGSRTFTRADIDKLRDYSATLARRYRSMLAASMTKNGRPLSAPNVRRMWADWSRSE